MEQIIQKEITQKEGIKTYKEVIQDMKVNWTTKEQFKDCSISYPSYGRGLTPNINMNTFMVQQKMASGPNKIKMEGTND